MTLKKFEVDIRVCIFHKQSEWKNVKFREKGEQFAQIFKKDIIKKLDLKKS